MTLLVELLLQNIVSQLIAMYLAINFCTTFNIKMMKNATDITKCSD